MVDQKLPFCYNMSIVSKRESIMEYTIVDAYAVFSDAKDCEARGEYDRADRLYRKSDKIMRTVFEQHYQQRKSLVDQ